MSTVLAQHVGYVELPVDMDVDEKLGCNRLTHLMVGEGVVSLVKGRAWDGRAGDDGLVITKHEAFVHHRHTEIAERDTEVNDL